MVKRAVVWLVGCIALGLVLTAPLAAQQFAFAQVTSLTDMQRFLRSNFPLGSDKGHIRAVMEAAGAKRYAHPEQDGVEKYVYDINLCDLYVWRWNVSISSAADGGLSQVYVNGDPVHSRGEAAPTPESTAQQGATQQILVGQRARPEASKGESSLGYIMFDVNSGSRRISDEFVVGAGPSNANPHDPGRMHAYEAERWRSIFDDERARSVVPFAGSCA